MRQMRFLVKVGKGTNMKTNDIKKGTRIQLFNGWYGTMMDNARGNIRIVDVEGIYREVGSVYSHDIAAAFVGGSMVPVVHTPAQLKCRAMNTALFGG